MKFTLDIKLPFDLYIKEDQRHGSSYEFGDFFSTFYRFEKEITIQGEPPVIDICTGIRLIFLPKDELYAGMEKDDALRSAVLNCLEYVNRFIDAVRTSFELSHIYNITISDLPKIMIIDFDGENYLYLTQPQEILRDSKVLNSDGLKKVGSILATWDSYPEQFLVNKFFDSAKSYLYREQTLNAIVDLQTSFEIYIRNTHRLILIKNGTSEQDIERASKIAFRNIIEQHLARYLDADLSFNKPGPIKDWYEKLYIIRNEVVHQGQVYISSSVAYTAYDAYVTARDYIADLLVSKNYLDSEGKVDLSLFRKSIKNNIDMDEVIKRLKENGMIDDVIVEDERIEGNGKEE